MVNLKVSRRSNRRGSAGFFFMPRAARDGGFGRLAVDLAGRLVLAQTLEARLTQQAILRPFGESNLANQFRLYPMDAAAARKVIQVLVEWGPVLLQLFQSLAQVPQHLPCETGADFSGVDQTPAVWLVMSHEQRTEPDARPLGVGEAADDELLPPGTLDLQPRMAPPANVWRIQFLGDDPFLLMPAGVFEKGYALFLRRRG